LFGAGDALEFAHVDMIKAHCSLGLPSPRWQPLPWPRS